MGFDELTQDRTDPAEGTQTDPDEENGAEPGEARPAPVELGDGTIAGSLDSELFGDRTEERLPFALTSGKRQTIESLRAGGRSPPPAAPVSPGAESTASDPPDQTRHGGVKTRPQRVRPASFDDTDVAVGLIDPRTGELIDGPALSALDRGDAANLRVIVDSEEEQTSQETPRRRRSVHRRDVTGLRLVPIDKRRFGRYSLLCRIASGGMADLFLASVAGPGGFEKLVAIKRIHEHLAKDPELIQMFLDEARLVARISHPNVVNVIELGTVDGAYFIAMEYVAGQTLRLLAREAVLPLPLAARLVSQAAAGLHVAHELCNDRGEPLGVVHRDVSPGNILVSYDGVVKVADFGVARARSNLHTTRSGTVKGKFAYMAPEQAAGDPVDRRADIFALGVILYEITTRRRLFKASSEHVTLARVIAGEVVPPSRLVSKYPPELEQIVMRALARKPSARFQTANEAHDALEAFIYRSGRRVTPMTISGLMRRVFAAQIQHREEILRSCRQVDESHLGDAASSLAEEPSFTFEGTVSSTRPPVSGPRRSFPVWVVISLGFSVALFAAALLLSISRFGPDGDRGQAAARSSSMVTISIRTIPAAATVAAEGRRLPTPARWRVKRTDREVELAVSAPGHVTRRLSLAPTRSTQLVIALDREGTAK